MDTHDVWRKLSILIICINLKRILVKFMYMKVLKAMYLEMAFKRVH